MLINKTKKEFDIEIKRLKDFLNNYLVKEILSVERDNRYIQSAKLRDNSEMFTRIGYLDKKAHKFTLYNKEQIAKILDKEFEPKLFYVKNYNKSRAYEINLPYYTYIILFRIGNTYYKHEPEYDGYDFIKIVKNMFKDPSSLVHVSNMYESKPNKEGNPYRIQIYKNEQYDHWRNTIYYTIQLSLIEIIKGKKYDISGMELDDLIETFEITNKEAIDFIKECFDNNGIICETSKLFTYNKYNEFVYLPKKDEINALYAKLDNLKNSITFVEPKPLQPNVTYIKED